MSVDKLVNDILGERPAVKDQALRDLVDARMKKGGAVVMAKGGVIKSIARAIAKELPEAKAAQKTQIPGTEPTYRKAYDILEREMPGGRTLDYGAGLGHGSKLMGAESFEPFPREGFRPTFVRPEDIPTEEFDRLVNLNVLNVMPREMRDATVENIGRVMRPGGMGIVTTRGRDVMNAAGEMGPEPMSLVTSIGTYQKGFTPEELREYLRYMLGKEYDISRLNLGPAGAMVRKKEKGRAEGGEVKKADGGGIGKNVGRGMAGLTRSRQSLDPREIQAMMLDVPAGLGVPFAEAGAEYLRGNIEDAKTSAAIDTALTAIPGVAAVAKPAYRAVRSGIQKAAPTVREAARGALEAGMESGLIQGPSYAVKPSGGQWLSGYKGDPAQMDVKSRVHSGSPQSFETTQQALERHRQIADKYTEETGSPPTQEMLDRISRLELDLERMSQGSAINRWIDTNLNNYFRKQMGTPEDPVLKLAEQGILHMPYQETGLLKTTANAREAAGFPREGLAKTDLGRMWETMSDRLIQNIEAGKLRDPEYMRDIGVRYGQQKKAFGKPDAPENQPDFLSPEEVRMAKHFRSASYPPAHRGMLENNPWLERVDPETPIYKLSRPFGEIPDEAAVGFDHVIDVLKQDLAAGRIRPEQLSKMSVEQAVRRTYEYDIERAAAMAKAIEQETAGLSTVKSFDDGFRIIQLDKPGQFAQESDRMGHSVRGYEPTRRSEDWTEASGADGYVDYGHGGWDAIKSGDAQVFSIRDAKNQPHVTIEVGGPRYPGDNPVQAFKSVGKPYSEAQQEAVKRIGLTEAKFPPDMPVEQRNEMQAKFEQAMQDIFAEHGGKLERRITQIKGKQNRAPDENYLPYIQQFIREGNYEIAGDLKNTGLIDTHTARSWDYGFPDKYVSLQDALPANTPRYVTESELNSIRQTGKFEPGFKEGGEVRMAGGGPVKGALVDAVQSVVKRLGDEATKAGTKPIAKESVINTTVNKAADRIAKDNPKLSESEVAKKAEREALAKLKWERQQKPELEKRYGALESAKFSDPLSKRQRNVPEVVQARIERARDFLAQPVEPWKPPRPELQAFDRAMIKDALEGFPGVEQTRFPRYSAPRSDLGYIDEIYDDPVNRELIEMQIKRGLPLGGETFYGSLYPLKAAALERGIAPGKFEQFVYETAPASARNSILNEMAVGQFLRDMKARGLPLDEETVTREMAKFKQQYGTGLPLMPVHREGVRKVIEEGQNLRDLSIADIPTNYKIPTYGTQKAGDFGKSMVLDVHESAGQTMGSRYHPYFTEQGGFGPAEYGPAEAKMLGIAEELGIPGGMAQAGRWFGGGELTGLKSPRGDALDLLERQAAYTLQGLGVNPTPRNVRNYVLDMIETGRGVLMPYFKSEGIPDVRVEKKKGGPVTKGALPKKRA